MFVTFFRRTSCSLALSLTATFSPAVSMADESSGRDVYIQQISSQQQYSSTAQPARKKITGTISPALSGFENQIVALGNRLPRGVTQAQQGQGHTAIATIQGRTNAVGQFQVGRDHFSSIDVIGANNRVVVMQRRQNAFSDIEVSGANKTIYHLQLGPTARLKEVPFRTATPETLMIIDNGKRAYVRRMK
jgi:hypothetical protein